VSVRSRTPAGLPAKGRSVKASTIRIRMAATLGLRRSRRPRPIRDWRPGFRRPGPASRSLSVECYRYIVEASRQINDGMESGCDAYPRIRAWTWTRRPPPRPGRLRRAACGLRSVRARRPGWPRLGRTRWTGLRPRPLGRARARRTEGKGAAR
jgi:hypothetical protein